ncbi:DUF3365 domain-containing protein [Thiomicrorhabdus sp. ZW0627]|uniref:Tll0287-like domain-containing protein n=1 Tax=Thiomicrorhabdus sp. ZW0627 TaxID=3039774 RepID=UPI002436FD39|nr:DUF3365 domain-containing protein [Thiomicrorhabdus sp. ZW0627]MDG6774440.1 DUF3365 domain-containing protein [Thiomicrorhabdus sp. ZW0627]
MKKLIIAVVLGAVSLSAAAQDNSISEKQLEARQIAKQFLGSLKPELGKAMKSGGPVFAVGKCHKISPEIAQKLTESTGWNVKRVSLKPRATTANPDNWETSTLKWFNEQAASGKDVTKLEKFEIVKVDGQDTYRYMKAIPTGDICLTCHGTAVPANVTQKLQELYPSDKATGYHKGEIRGAFSFKQPKL